MEISGLTKKGSSTETGCVAAIIRLVVPNANATISACGSPNKTAVIRIGTWAIVMRIIGKVMTPSGVFNMTTVRAIIKPMTVISLVLNKRFGVAC